MNGRIEVGVKLPTSGPLASIDNIRTLALAAERIGYHSAFVTDHIHWTAVQARHHFPIGAVEAWTEPIRPDYYEPITLLSHLGALTEKLVLGTAVLAVPLRSPVLLAKQLACLDQLLGGRLIVGVGIGGTTYAEGELSASGLRHHAGKRGPVADEWLEVVRCIWNRPTCTYQGEFITVTGAEVYPKPLQDGGPPLWIAGPSDASMRRAARVGDGWILSFLHPTDVRRKVEQLNGLAREHGRGDTRLRVALEVWVSMAGSVEAARSRARATLESLPVPGLPQPSSAGQAGAEFHLFGRPDDMLERVDEYRRAGVDHFLLRLVARDISEAIESLHEFKEGVVDRLVGRPSTLAVDR